MMPSVVLEMMASVDDVMMALSQELSSADKAGVFATGEGALDKTSRFMTGLPIRVCAAPSALFSNCIMTEVRGLSTIQINVSECALSISALLCRACAGLLRKHLILIEKI